MVATKRQQKAISQSMLLAVDEGERLCAEVVSENFHHERSHSIMN